LTKNLEIDKETTLKMKNDCEKISKFYLTEGQRVVDNIVSIEVIENTFRFIEEEMDCRLESLKISVDDSREKFLKIFNSKIRKYTRKFHSNIINKPRLEDFGILKHPIF
jgi:NADH:ubiquinone oxidoreductase subunit D